MTKVNQETPEEPVFELSAVETADCAILNAVWRRICYDLGQPAPTNPFVGVIDLAKSLMLASAEQHPEWRAEIDACVSQFTASARRKMN